MPLRIGLLAAAGALCLAVATVCPADDAKPPPAPGSSSATASPAAAPAQPPAQKPDQPAAQTGTQPPPPATPPRPAKKAPSRTIFAAPMANETGREQYDPVAAGIGDLVDTLMATTEEVRMVERQKFAALADEQALKLKGLTADKFAIEAGKLLEADTVLTGRLYTADTKLLVAVQALDIATARVVASEQMACRPEDLMETALQLARSLAKQLAAPLPEIDLRNVDKSPVAGLHLAKGLAHYYAGDLDSALMQFMRAIDLDPDVVDVHYWSGMCYYRQAEWPHAVIEWEKFLKRAPNSRYAVAVTKLLADARAKADAATPPAQRLAPDDKPKG